MWISFDVMCCTRQHLERGGHRLDRYWTITRHLQYTLRTRRRASMLMIALTWALSALIALAPLLFGWGRGVRRSTPALPGEPGTSYAVFSTCGAFYLHAWRGAVVYWKIYKAAKFRFGRRCRAVLPLPSTVQVRRGLGNGDLGKDR